MEDKGREQINHFRSIAHKMSVVEEELANRLESTNYAVRSTSLQIDGQQI